VCCSVLQCVAVCCSVLQCAAVCSSVLQCVAVCCSVLQCVAVCCIAREWEVLARARERARPRKSARKIPMYISKEPYVYVKRAICIYAQERAWRRECTLARETMWRQYKYGSFDMYVGLFWHMWRQALESERKNERAEGEGKSPTYMSKEPYIHVKRAIFMMTAEGEGEAPHKTQSHDATHTTQCQKSPMYMSKEPYIQVKRAICISQNTRLRHMLSHIRLSHRWIESCPTHEWVMSRIGMSHMSGVCHIM